MSELGMHNLVVASGSKKSKKRIGRGNASGKGNYSGKGNKGQRARSGGKSGLILFGVKNYLQRIPKNRGFKRHRIKMSEVGLSDLQKLFNDGDNITINSLIRKGLINRFIGGVKILGGCVLAKKLNVSANAFTASAKDAIVKAGGQAILVERISVEKNKKAK